MNVRKQLAGTYVLISIGVAAVAIATFELGIPDPHASIKNHHIQHVFYIIGGSLFGIAVAAALSRRRKAADWPGSGLWLAPALVVSAVVMAAMWPSFYPFIEAHPLLHALQHGFYIVASFVVTLTAYLFARSAGWLSAAMLTVMAWGAAFGFGVAPGPSPLLAQVAGSPTESAPGGAAAAADGEAVYLNCQACHQPDGAGLAGAFPPLRGHVPELLAADGGRAYLLKVVLFGVQGPITVAGSDFNSAMAPWAHLSDGELAAVLNHVSTAWDNSFPEGQEPFSADEVAEQRAADLSPADVHVERGQLGLP